MRVSIIIPYTSSFRNHSRPIRLNIRYLRDFRIFIKNNSRATNILIPFMNNYLRDYLNCKHIFTAPNPANKASGPFPPAFASERGKFPSTGSSRRPRRFSPQADGPTTSRSTTRARRCALNPNTTAHARGSYDTALAMTLAQAVQPDDEADGECDRSTGKPVRRPKE